MSNMSDNSDEEMANNVRKAKQDAQPESDGIVDNIEHAFGTLTNPLSRERVDESDLEARREANDQDTRDA